MLYHELVAALRSATGASRVVYQLLREGAIEGAASGALFLEYEMVLLREEHLEATGMNREEVSLILNELAATLRPVVPYFQWRPLLYLLEGREHRAAPTGPARPLCVVASPETSDDFSRARRGIVQCTATAGAALYE